jgi:hypothetical protein
LRQLYGASPATATTDLSSEDFIGMWCDHEEMKDSSAWVRQERENGWKA